MLSIALTPLTPMDTQDNLLVFEIFAFDTSKQSHLKTTDNLLNLFASNNSLWYGKARIDFGNRQIKDDCIEIGVNPIKCNQDNKNKDITSFSIVIKGKYNFLESKRILILEFLKGQKLETQHIVKDEISERIAVKIYPCIYRVENSLRAYITKFMTTKIGVNWWKTEAPQDFNKKVNDRKNNEKEFATYIDNKLYLIDFDDLGEYIYKLSSGCITKEDLINKINRLEETPEAIRKLKEEIKSNYDKFFKELFKDKGFQPKWEEFYKIRNKVAHNNLFTNDDLNKAQEIYRDLIEIIEYAGQRLEELILTPEEVQSIQEETNNLEELLDHNRATYLGSSADLSEQKYSLNYSLVKSLQYKDEMVRELEKTINQLLKHNNETMKSFQEAIDPLLKMSQTNEAIKKRFQEVMNPALKLSQASDEIIHKYIKMVDPAKIGINNLEPIEKLQKFQKSISPIAKQIEDVNKALKKINQSFKPPFPL
jgi:methyl-accepting chemotaxis protein